MVDFFLTFLHFFKTFFLTFLDSSNPPRQGATLLIFFIFIFCFDVFF